MLHFSFKFPRKILLSALLLGAMQQSMAYSIGMCEDYVPPIENIMNGEYYEVYCPSDGIVLLRNDSDDAKAPKAHYFSQHTGKKLFHYDDGKMFNDGMAIVEKDGKWGIIDNNNKVIIPFQYDRLTMSYKEPYWIIARKNEKEGMIDRQGQIQIPFEYDDIGQFSDGLAKVEKEGKTAFINTHNKVVIDWAEREYETEFIYGLTYYHKNGKNYVMNTDGKVVFSTPYHISYIDKNHIIIIHNEKYGLLNHQGKVILPPIYQYVASEKQGLIAVAKNNKLGFVNKHGKIVVPMQYDYQDEGYIYHFRKLYYVNDVVKVRQVGKNGKWGLLNRQGKIVAPFIYDEMQHGLGDKTWDNSSFKHPPKRQQEQYWIAVWKNGKAGFIDNTGKIQIPLEYDEVFPYSEGKAAVVKNGKVGFIDAKNNIVVPLKYQYVRRSYAEGLSVSYQPYFFFGGKAMMLNPNIKYEDNQEYPDDYGDEKPFYIDEQGQVVHGKYQPIVRTKPEQKKKPKK